MRNTTIGIAIGAVCALALVSTVVSGQDNSAREAKDRVEIESLMWHYARALDSGNGTAYAAAYTEDGQFGTGANATKGREALKKLADRPAPAAPATGEAARPPMYHMNADTWVEFIDKDHARHHAYYLTVVAAGGQNVPARVAAAGRAINTLERVKGKWLIKVRDVSPTTE
jgi:hypothetical protein